jgi:hypothetical protein
MKREREKEKARRDEKDDARRGKKATWKDNREGTVQLRGDRLFGERLPPSRNSNVYGYRVMMRGARDV